jgi:hypothetical protein
VVAISRRWLLEAASPSRVDVRHRSYKLNFYLGIVLVVFMAVGVVALVCCCYRLEWRLRLQARRASRSSGILGQNAEKATKQETNLSVMMPGDSIPSFLAKAKPHGSADLAESVPPIRAKDALQTLR